MTHGERLWLAAVLFGALALRLIHVWTLHRDVLFDHPVLDEQRYVDAARDAAAGRTYEDRPFWQPPGVIYALDATFRVAGPGLIAPRVVQAIVSAACCALLFLIGRRLFSTRVGLAAATILALHGVVIFESGELLPPTWMLGFDLLALWLLLRADKPPWAFAAGLALGVSAVFSPVILPFVVVAAVAVRRPVLIAALIAGVLLPIAPVTLRNWRHGHELVLVSTNGGLNLFIGNNADYTRTFAIRPGRHWDELATRADHDGAHTPATASAWYTRRALAYAAAHPAGEAALLARKEYLFWNAAEIPRDTDVYAARRGSPIVAALVWPRPFWFPGALLLPLALCGLALAWPERKRLLLPYGFLATQAIFVPLFFVTARHRVPALAMFALFAAAGVALAAQRPRRWPIAAAATALIAIVSLPTREAKASYGAELDFYRGLAYAQQHDAARAAEAYRRATREDPGDARPWYELGNLLLTEGRTEEAEDALMHAGAADPWDSRPFRRVSMSRMKRGDLDGAIAALEAEVDSGAHEPAYYAADHLNLALLTAKRGQYARAVEHLHAAQAADPDYVRREVEGMTRAAVADPHIDDAAFWRALADLNVGPTAEAARERAQAAGSP